MPSLHGEVRTWFKDTGIYMSNPSSLIISDLDFTTLTSNLDNTASEIVTYQRDSTVQRKDLAQKTKDFRKYDDATKLTEVKGLLKGTSVFTSSCIQQANMGA
jgi:hypothetical protein